MNNEQKAAAAYDAIFAGLRLLANALKDGTVKPDDGDIGDILTSSGVHTGLTSFEVHELADATTYTGPGHARFHKALREIVEFMQDDPSLPPEAIARRAGWEWDEGGPFFYRNAPDSSPLAPYQYFHSKTPDWRALCEAEGLLKHS